MSLKPFEVTTPKIATKAVTGEKIADNTIENRSIKAGTITPDKLTIIPVGRPMSPGLETSEIKDAAITSNKIAPNAITTDHIAANAVATDDIKDNAITTEKIRDGAITREKVADRSVNTADIVDGAVTSVKLANNSVTAAKIAANAVGASEIAANAVGTSEIANGAVTTEKIGLGQVTGDRIQNTAINTEKIADGAVTPAKLSFTPTAAGIYVPRLVTSYDFLLGSFPVSGAWQVDGLNLSGIVPAGARAVHLGIVAISPVGPSNFVLRRDGVNLTNTINCSPVLAGVPMDKTDILAIDSDMLVDYYIAADITTLQLAVLGWFI